MRAMSKPDAFINDMLRVKEAEEDSQSMQTKLEFNFPTEN